MSGINLTDVLERIKGRFEDYNAELEWQINGEIVSLENIQDATKNKDSIRSLSFGTPDTFSYSFSYSRELEWTIQGLGLYIRQTEDGKGYKIYSDVLAYADEDLSEYSERDDFESVVEEIWREIENGGYRHAAYSSAMELGGDYTDYDEEIFETIEDALNAASKGIEHILDAIATMEDFYARVTDHYE